MKRLKNLFEVSDFGGIEGTSDLSEETDTNILNDSSESEITGDQNTESSDSQGSLEGDQQVAGTPNTEQEYDWTKDDRFKRMWGGDSGGDPNKLFKSYVNLENEFGKIKPIREQFDNLTNKFKEHNMDLNEIDNYIKEYNEIKDPNNPKNQDLQILEEFMGNPEYAQRIGNLFRDIHVENLQRQYPNMNAQQIEEQVQLKEELKGLKEAENERKKEADFQTNLKVIDENVKKINKFSSDRGFEFTDDIKNDILDTWAKQPNMPAQAIFSIFLEKYSDKVQESWENKMRDNLMKGKQKIDKTNIPNATKGSSKSIDTSSSANSKRLSETLRRAFGG